MFDPTDPNDAGDADNGITQLGEFGADTGEVKLAGLLIDDLVSTSPNEFS